jgi:hypothetical protein
VSRLRALLLAPMTPAMWHYYAVLTCAASWALVLTALWVNPGVVVLVCVAWGFSRESEEAIRKGWPPGEPGARS